MFMVYFGVFLLVVHVCSPSNTHQYNPSLQRNPVPKIMQHHQHPHNTSTS